MNLTPRNITPRNRLFDLDALFSPSLLGAGWPSVEDKAVSAFAPRIDITETTNSYEITAELPGAKKEDVHVSLENGVLSLQAETKQESKEESEGTVIRQERRYGTFYRSFDLGSQVHEQDIQATFSDGVLKIVAPKHTQEESTSRKIEIR